MNTPTNIEPKVFGSFTAPSSDELRNVWLDTARERAWLGETLRRFTTTDDINQATTAGDLIRIEPTSKFRPIARFLNPDLTGSMYAPYLTPAAAVALEDLTDTWQMYAERLHVSPDVRLAVTSFVRSEQHQRALVTAGKLAVESSSHTAGYAFDIDYSGYYLVRGSEVRNVTSRPDAYRAVVGQQLEAQFGLESQAVLVEPQSEFDQRVMTALKMAAGHYDNRMNAVLEFSGTPNACLHVGVNPDYEQLAA